MKVLTHQKGFTLLEAVVAIAIFAMGATALYSAINTHLKTLERIDHVNTRNSAIESAIEFMSTVDPVTTPQGQAKIGEMTLMWEATAPIYAADVLDEQNIKTINQASLFDTAVSLSRQGDLISVFNITLLGVNKAKGVGDGFFD
ncbi:MAG: general secretion pathway protein I [Pseudohongiellaceae bacterium]|jgi:general secretion pathway protein I